jgi:hypothetical protein
MPVLGAIWAALTAALGWLVRSQIGRWIAIALAAIGIQFAVTEGVMYPLIDYIASNASGGVGAATQWFGFFNVDRYITLILSAYASAAAVGFVAQRVRA